MMFRGIALAMLLTLCTAAGAEMVYKYERRDGSQVYSDKPIPGARLIERYPYAAPAPAQQEGQPAEASGDPAPPAEPAPAAPEPAPAPAGARSASDPEIKVAEKAVQEAQDRLQSGLQPQLNERKDDPEGGASQLSEEYFARVQELEKEYRNAVERLDEVYQKRGARR
jgi:hypothetical protein